MKRNILYLIILFVYLPHSVCSSIWQRKIINYGRNQYQAGFQNWNVEQADNEWMYFSNSNGLLEFDGVNWNLFPIKNTILRSTKTIGNRIYAGGSSEFGYYEPNSSGVLVYKSLATSVQGWGGEVWSIYENEGKIYFIADGAIHIYTPDGEVETIPTYELYSKIDCSLFTNGHLYFGTSDGIYTMNKENEIKPLDYCDILKDKKIVGLLPVGDEMIAVTALSGLYSIYGNNCQKMNSIADEFIRRNQLFCATNIDSKIALGSVQNGAFLFDLNDTEYYEIFNIQTGLKNNTVLNLYFDKDSNLWFGLDKGIGYADLNSPIRPLFAKESPIGTGYCVAEYKDELYWGTNQGLYKSDEKGNFQLIKNSEGQIWSLLCYDNTLFSSGDNGIIAITPSLTYKIELRGAWEIRPLSADNNKLIVATYSGFGVLEKKNEKWVYSHIVPDFFNSTRGFMEDIINYDFWCINSAKKVVERITVDPGLWYIKNIKEYPLDPTSSFAGNPYLRIIDNNLNVCTKNGIFRYDRLSDKFVPYIQLESILDGGKYYDYLSADASGNIWFVADGKLKCRPMTAGNYAKKTYNWDLSAQLVNGYENVYLLDSASAIVAIDESFLKINFSENINENKETNVFIRNLILTDNDSIINYRNKDEKIVLPYSLNTFSIHYGSSNYSQSSDVSYSYILEGLEEKWSQPSSKTVKEYTNLSEGKYVFKVKAIVRGVEQPGIIATIDIEITPPWYRSTLAYILYTAVILAVLFLFIKRLVDKYKKDLILKKEELIAQRKKHEEESRIKDQEIYKLQNESLQQELHYKTQELTGKVLNLLRKNEILEDVKKNVIGISKAIDEQRQMPVIKQRVIRLITQINNSIEHDDDFEIFKSNFDLIHQDFFKLLDEKHPSLTRNDKILCAYLKMNFSSKEIAPLFNISIRGVEVNRYRLRKKMDLDRTINLSEYLQNISG